MRSMDRLKNWVNVRLPGLPHKLGFAALSVLGSLASDWLSASLAPLLHLPQQGLGVLIWLTLAALLLALVTGGSVAEPEDPFHTRVATGEVGWASGLLATVFLVRALCPPCGSPVDLAVLLAGTVMPLVGGVISTAYLQDLRLKGSQAYHAALARVHADIEQQLKSERRFVSEYEVAAMLRRDGAGDVLSDTVLARLARDKMRMFVEEAQAFSPESAVYLDTREGRNWKIVKS